MQDLGDCRGAKTVDSADAAALSSVEALLYLRGGHFRHKAVKAIGLGGLPRLVSSVPTAV